MIITVASGKGGTGKTTFAVNLAYALAGKGENVRLLDCDVEEPNDHLFVKPVFDLETPVTVCKPVWEKAKCNACGKCAEACNYNAIAVVKDKVLVFNELCHSCGVCAYVCPEKALTEKECVIGKVHVSSGNRPFFFAHGILNIGEALAPKVVNFLKKHIDGDAVNILDASPGASCSVMEAVDGADAAVLVTEPTPFGLNDLKLAVGLCLKMRVPTGIVVNRSDGEDDIINQYAENTGVPILGRIPFKREYAESYSAGNILVEQYPELETNLLDIYQNIRALKGQSVPDVPGEEEMFPVERSISTLQKGSAVVHKEITVISGKGGTGKTTILGAFAELADEKVLVDNDVDAADLHLLLKPATLESQDFVGGQKAVIDAQKCVVCGKCERHCHYNAIKLDGPGNGAVEKTYRVDALACEGCGFCSIVCPAAAVSMKNNISGRWYISDTDLGPMVHARLGIAEENSGRLVTQVRNAAVSLSEALHKGLILADGPPGTGCPVIASISGTDLVIIVTEPTVSGVHDMKRVFELTKHFGVSALVIINKADLNAEQALRIEEIARDHNSRVIARIPFDRSVHDALMEGKTIINYGKCIAEASVRKAWSEVLAELDLTKK